jgi:hypothetical protein
MNAFQKETVLSVKHWTDSLFSFTATRDPGFRFQNGQFAMIGLEVEGRPLVRAYSMASANHEDYLELFSIKVPDGPLTSRLQNIREGHQIFVSRKPTGTLVLRDLRPGQLTQVTLPAENVGEGSAYQGEALLPEALELFAALRAGQLEQFILEMNDWLVDLQQWEGVAPDLAGRFYDPPNDYGAPHASSDGVYLEGLIAAYRVAREASAPVISATNPTPQASCS